MMSSSKKLQRAENYLIRYKQLNFTTLWANSADDKLIIFFLFLPEIGFDISCKLSPLEIICKKCQSLFLGKNKKNISKCYLLTFLHSMLSTIG